MREPTLGDMKLDRYHHVCAFFNSEDEEDQVMMPYYSETLAWREKALHIVGADKQDEHLQRLRRHRIDVDACMASGQLQVLPAEKVYLQNGVFDKDSMLATVVGVFARAMEEGYPRLRIMGNMGWAFPCTIGADELIQYEAEVNQVLARTRQPAVCVYDMAWLSGTMMIDILRCHPLTLIGGVVHENPFYIPPDKLVPQLQQRQQASAVNDTQRRPDCGRQR
jgi:hypothetical protein